MIHIEITATAVAWYGAIVATAAVLLSGWNAWRDRARIVVSGVSGYRLVADTTRGEAGDYISIRVVNHGRRPRTISKVGLKLLENGKVSHVIAKDSIPRGPQELTEGREYTWIVRYGDSTGISLSNVTHVWASDATGKMFYTKIFRPE